MIDYNKREYNEIEILRYNDDKKNNKKSDKNNKSDKNTKF